MAELETLISAQEGVASSINFAYVLYKSNFLRIFSIAETQSMYWTKATYSL